MMFERRLYGIVLGDVPLVGRRYCHPDGEDKR